MDVDAIELEWHKGRVQKNSSLSIVVDTQVHDRVMY